MGNFALYFAVFDHAELRNELIRLLDVSHPGLKSKIVTLTSESVDPLDEIRIQAGQGVDPVMVIGLERAVGFKNHCSSVLRVLNLEREDWSALNPRPVVFWVPEWLMGVLGRDAPDFVDWRTDTLHFRSGPLLQRELAAFDDALWRGQLDQQMSERDRRARIQELQSRLRVNRRDADPVVQNAHAIWLEELGSHFLFLGELDTALTVYEDLEEWARNRDDRHRLAMVYHQLAIIAQYRGEFEVALERYRWSLALSEELGDREGVLISYHQLGNVSHLLGLNDEALEWYQRSLAMFEELGNPRGVAASYHQIGVLAQERGDLEEAMKWYRKSLAMKEHAGDRGGIASSYHQLGNASFLMGSFDEALDWYRRSLDVSEEVGDRVGMARSFYQMGRLFQAQALYQQAMDFYRKSLDMSVALGDRVGIARNMSQIGHLLTEADRAEDAISWTLRALAVRLELGIGVPETQADIRSLRQQREALGEVRYREMLDKNVENEEVLAAVLRLTAGALDEPTSDSPVPISRSPT